MRPRTFALSAGVVIAIVTAVSVSTSRQNLSIGPASAAACPTNSACLPALQLIDLHGKQHTSASLAGKVVVINLWATWCGPCRKEIPAIARVAGARANDVVVLGLLQDDPSEGELLNFMSDSGLDYPVVRPTPEIRAAFPTQGLPTTLVYDRRGILVEQHMGLIDEPQLTSLIEKAAHHAI